MRLRTATTLLRFAVGQQTSTPARRALATVLAAADAGEPAALRALARAVASRRREAVWSVWLEPRASGEPARRWSSPVLTELAADVSTVPDQAVDAAWSDWLEEHDTALWSLLTSWNRPATNSRTRALSRLALGDGAVSPGPGPLAETAARFDHPLGERARERLLALADVESVDLFCAAAVDSGSPDAGAFCTAHQLAPSDSVERAVFFVRTGQHDQYRALDPDGSLLALGYQGASAEARAALREAMTGLGGIDVLRVLAGQRSRDGDAALLGRQERAYLVRQFTERGEWDRLWRFTVLLPLAEAVGAIRLFRDWRPSGEDDRRVFDELLAADPVAVSGHAQAYSATSPGWRPPRTRIVLPDLNRSLFDVLSRVGFSPDGRQLAFASGRGEYAGTIDLGANTLSRLYRSLGISAHSVAHLGSDAVVVAGAHVESGVHIDDRIRYGEGAGRLRHPFRPARDSRIHGLERVAGDRAFIVLSSLMHGGKKEWTLSVGQATHPLAGTGILDGLDFWEPKTVVEPGGRLVAVLDHDTAVVADLADSVVNVLDSNPRLAGYDPLRAALSSSALVRANSDGDLQVWREPLTSTKPPASGRLWPPRERTPRLQTLTDLAWSPALRRFLALSEQRTGDLEYQQYLKVLDVPESPGGPLPQALASHSFHLGTQQHDSRARIRLSPQGDVLALHEDWPAVIELYAVSALTLRPIIGKPMGLMSHQDLAEVVKVLENPVLGEETRGTLGLLRTCLEHHFRHDVRLSGTHATTPPGHHEIELGG